MEDKGNLNPWQRGLAFIERMDWLFLLLACAALAFCLFFRLGAPSAAVCDEARHGINGYEMVKSGEYILSTYQYEPDYFNLKPPLSYWLVAMGYKLFGFNRFAMRFYSAASYFLTAVILALFLRKRYGKLEGIACVGLFLAQDAIIFNHMARSADTDALLTLLVTVAIVSTVRFCESRKTREIYIACAMFALAFLCKSWHAGLIPLIMLAILLITGGIRSLRLKNWALMFAIAVLPVAAWAFARYRHDGITFLEQMFQYDLLTRASTSLAPAEIGPTYYIEFMLARHDGHNVGLRMTALLVVIGIGLSIQRNAAGLASKEVKKGEAILAAWYLIPFIAVSLSKTKFTWYVYPGIVALFAFAAIVLCRLARKADRSLLAAVIAVLVSVSLLNAMRLNMVRSKDEQNTEPRQVFFETCLQRDAEYAGRVCYWDNVEVIGFWQQGDMLQAELSADLVCKNGGTAAFLQAPDSLLFVDKENLSDGILLHEYSLYAENERYALIGKPG